MLKLNDHSDFGGFNDSDLRRATAGTVSYHSGVMIPDAVSYDPQGRRCTRLHHQSHHEGQSGGRRHRNLVRGASNIEYVLFKTVHLRTNRRPSRLCLTELTRISSAS